MPQWPLFACAGVEVVGCHGNAMCSSTTAVMNVWTGAWPLHEPGGMWCLWYTHRLPPTVSRPICCTDTPLWRVQQTKWSHYIFTHSYLDLTDMITIFFRSLSWASWIQILTTNDSTRKFFFLSSTSWFPPLGLQAICSSRLVHDLGQIPQKWWI